MWFWRLLLKCSANDDTGTCKLASAQLIPSFKSLYWSDPGFYRRVLMSSPVIYCSVSLFECVYLPQYIVPFGDIYFSLVCFKCMADSATRANFIYHKFCMSMNQINRLPVLDFLKWLVIYFMLFRKLQYRYILIIMRVKIINGVFINIVFIHAILWSFWI